MTTVLTRPRRLRIAALLGAGALLLGACSAEADDAESADAHAGETHHDDDHFEYSGALGPEHWGDIHDQKWKECAEGQAQSPIDLPSTASTGPASTSSLSIDYSPSSLQLINNGHTVQAKYDSGSSITVDDATYPLQQFHFHATSEHTVDGEETELEVHLVHYTDPKNGPYAVIGLLIEEGAADDAFEDVLLNLPAEESTQFTQVDDVEIDAAAMLPEEPTFIRYDGSLTTPGCTEGVTWLVASEPITMSRAQIDRFTDVYSENARPVQDLGGRELTVVGP